MIFGSTIDYYINLDPHIKATIIITLVLSLIFIFIGNKAKKMKPTDSSGGILGLFEMVIDGINKFTENNLGKRWKYYAPYLLTLTLFLVVSNMSGLFGFTPPTANVNVTLTLALISFFLIHFTGIIHKGLKGYLKGFMEPMVFMLPLNIIGELALPISLSLRLFGNILSGVIISTIVYGLAGWMAVAVTPILHAAFDIFFGLIQVAVFLLLTTIFISAQTE